MVSLDPERIISWVRQLELIKRGAESEIRLGSFMGLPAVYKLRVRKPYMHPELAERLSRARTRREAKVMAEARLAGVDAPRLYAVILSAGLIVMEYVEGRLLKEVIGVYSGWRSLVRRAGERLATLHKAGIVHGDPTTSNFIVSNGRLVMIDFGLSAFTEDLEERAVDVHLFRRALEASHAAYAEEAFNLFVEGYTSVLGSPGVEVVKRASEIALRGRYVEARRRSVWAQAADEGE
ncbi:MAG: Kae1-associated kinase Bud32 [Aquificota bacterium]|nr:Kae1-associated kinase Bud32 [Aquificota bacterium]